MSNKNFAYVVIRHGRVILAEKAVDEDRVRESLRIAGHKDIDSDIEKLKSGETVKARTMNHSYTFLPIYRED